jgi:predicted nucleic acid-binding protein
MSPAKVLVLDTNILLRGVFGTRVFSLLDRYQDDVIFRCPEICFEEARRHVTGIATRRNFDLDYSFQHLDRIELLVEVVDRSLYEPHEAEARARIERRDPNDWPILATTLLLDCPLWTEDRDFFGTGVATWTTDNIELYLRPH